MDHFLTTQISAAGMAAQKARLEAAALNLANMHVSAPPGAAGFLPMRAIVTSASTFVGLLREEAPAIPLPHATWVTQPGATDRVAYEPGHPHADEGGMVRYPAVDHTQEMMTVMTALRAYEANLAVLQITKTLAARALEIGSP